MTDLDIVCRALRFLGRDGTALDIEDGGEPYGEEYDIFCTLFYCVYAAADELARYYLPLRCSETLASEDGKYMFSSFGRNPVRIERVLSGGREIGFRQYAGYIEADAAKIEVEYSYAPKKREIDFEAEAPELEYGDIIALGATAEYCLIDGEAALAEMWEKRYREAISRAQLTSGCKPAIPPRRWV